MRKGSVLNMFVVVLVATVLFVPGLSVTAKAAEKANIYALNFDNITITNKEGQKVIFAETDSEDKKIGGNMPHTIKWNYGEDDESEYGQEHRLIVDESDEFTITPTKSKWGNFGYRNDDEGLQISMNSPKHPRAYINGDLIEKAQFINKGVKLTGNYHYDIGAYMPSQKDRINLENCYIFDYPRTISLQDSKKGVVLKGATGRITVSADKKFKRTRYYVYGGTSILKKEKDGTVSVKPGVKLTEKVSKTVTNLYLRPTNKGKNLFLTWNRVKGANYYFVYGYNKAKKKYCFVDDRLAQSQNFYNIPMSEVKKNKIYKFYVKAVKWNWDTGKVDKVIDKRSYAVWAVSAGNAKGNVSEITTNYKKLTKKMGQKVKLTATVKTKDGKKPISKTIRWFTSNKKIVKLNKTTGQCIFKKKGKCYIWAKAHNGKNSKKITVIVK